MAQQYTYSTVALPCPRTASSPPSDFPVLAQRYAALRLEALATAPNAFASTHAIESLLTPEQWGSKIWREDAVVLVCIAHPAGEPASNSAIDGTWVGSAILRGPMSLDDYTLPPESKAPQPGDDTEETRWQMTAVFASAAHRGRGLGKLLIQAAKEYAVAHTRTSTARRVRLRAMIHPDNTVVLGLYTGVGFTDVARATGKEAYRTNGDVAQWTALVAIVLEWLEEV
ncbi:hypothetical protein C8F01DRAFT_1174019 [Mycena amicta]|nr:hypothetical protein C8F01DRAFT_1174019 [Mycena amicta]